MNIFDLFDFGQVREVRSKFRTPQSAGALVEEYSPELLSSGANGMVMLSVGDEYESDFCFLVRQEFARLYFDRKHIPFSDLGHYTGDSGDLAEVLARLISYGSLPLVLSASQSPTFDLYQAYCRLEQTVNLISIDDQPDLGEPLDIPGENDWLSHVLSYSPNFLFNYALLGYQNYLSNPAMLKSLETMNFDLHRLGQIRDNVSVAEPWLRNSDFLSFDISSVRAGDSPANLRPGPNGLYAEEACQLVRYAGISNKLSSALICGWSATGGIADTQTAALVAQLIWHFCDGYINRIPDGVVGQDPDYTVYKLTHDSPAGDLVFYKDNRNGRWWMRVSGDRRDGRYGRHQLVPCSHEDYIQALKGEIPETWWRTYQKML